MNVQPSLHPMLYKKRKAAQIAATVITIAHLACQTHAAVTFFNDRTTFISTVNPTSSTDFSGAGADVNIDHRVSTDVGLFNVFYSTAGGVNQTLNTLQPTSSRLRLTVDDNTTPTFQTTEMTFQFSTPVTAFGFSIEDLGADREVWTFDVNGTTFNIADVIDASSNDTHLSGFAGFQSDTPISSISMVNMPLTTRGDLVYFTEAFVAVPEPSSTLIVGTCLLGGVVIFRRKRTKQAPQEQELQP